MNSNSDTNTTPQINNVGGSTTDMSEIHMDGSIRNFPQIYLTQEDVPSSSSCPPPLSQPQLPPTSAVEVQHFHSSAAESAAATTTTNIPEHTLYKNRLQEFTHKLSIQLPMYQTVDEGTQHVPRFRSTVWVDGKSYTNQVSFLNRKAAEHDAARLALEGLPAARLALERLPPVIKDEASPLVLENTMFSKSIMNEYATKLNVALPSYCTVQIIGALPVFVSSLVFNGTKYTGDASRNKKEAEQLAARRAILSILDDPGSETLFEIVKSKSRITAAVKLNASQVTDATNLSALVANTGDASHSLCLNMKVAGLEQPIGEASSSRKRRKNKKKADKKARLETPLIAAKVDIPSTPLVGGMVPPPLGTGYPPRSSFGTVPPIYNPAVTVPPNGWAVPPRPQPWYPQPPSFSVPPPAPYPQQPLFPVQNVRPPLPTTAPPALQTQITPPGLPTSTTSVPVSQPLFPVVSNNNTMTQNSTFSVAPLASSVPSITPVLSMNVPVDAHSSAISSLTNSYQAIGVPGGAASNSHSYASGPNTGGPSIGPPPVIANKAPVSQPATNEVYLVWDDEAMSMEERRMSLPKYQVHDENSQMSSIDAAIDKRIHESRLAGRMAF